MPNAYPDPEEEVPKENPELLAGTVEAVESDLPKLKKKSSFFGNISSLRLNKNERAKCTNESGLLRWLFLSDPSNFVSPNYY